MLSKRFSVFGVVCALASGALFAQDLAIDGKDFESGAADAKLAEIARQAAASGKTVVVSTPPYWQAKVAGKMRAAAPGLQVKTSDAFFENVLVRIVDGDKTAKPDAATKSAETAPKPVEIANTAKPAPRAEPRAEAVSSADSAKPETAAAVKPEPAQQVALASAAPAQHAKPASTETPAPAAPAAVESAPPAPAAAAPATAPQIASITPPPAAAATNAKPAASVDTAAIKRSFENQLNLGRPANGDIRAAQLQKGDEIFVHGPVRAVVRRERSRVELFWVEGELNLDRAELLKTDASRYRVDEPIRDVANPSLRAMHSEPKMFAAHVPTAQVRTDMERHFNDAKVIASRMRPDELRYGDLFYVYRTHAVVFRRTEVGFDRYWLDGELDLNQAGVIKDGDAYRIVSEKL
jgi:hypothetical protein